MSIPPPLLRRGWLLLWIAIAIALVARATSRRESRGVILDHLEFGRRLLHGEDVYGPWKSDPDAPIRPLHAPYPPSFGLLTMPFAVLDAALGTRAARAAWALLQLGCLLAAALAMRSLAAPRAPPPAATQQRIATRSWQLLCIGTFVLGLRFVLRDMHGGGGNIINLGLCLGAFWLAERQRPAAAGLLLAFSLVTKPTQLWLLPVFWLLGHRRTLGWTVLSAAMFVLLTALLQRLELAPWWRWIEGSWRLGTQPDPFAVPALDFPPFEWMNQSLRCALARWFGEVPEQYAARVLVGMPPGLGWSTTAVAWLVRGSSLAALWLVLSTAWRARHHATARLWTFAAALVLSVLLSPLSWKAHHVALLPVLLLLLQRTVASSGARRGWLIALLLGWTVCCLPGGDLVGDDRSEWLNSLYIVTAWDVLLLLVAVRIARATSSTANEHDDAALRAGSAQRVR